MEPRKDIHHYRKSVFLHDLAITNQEKTIASVKKGKVKYAEVSDKVLLSLMNWELANLKENRESVIRDLERLEKEPQKENQNKNHINARNGGEQDTESRAKSPEPSRESETISKAATEEQKDPGESIDKATVDPSSREGSSEKSKELNGVTDRTQSNSETPSEQASFLIDSFVADSETDTGEESKRKDEKDAEETPEVEPPLDPILTSVSSDKNEDSNSEKKAEPESSTKSRENSPLPESLGLDLNQNSDDFQLDYWT